MFLNVSVLSCIHVHMPLHMSLKLNRYLVGNGSFLTWVLGLDWGHQISSQRYYPLNLSKISYSSELECSFRWNNNISVCFKKVLNFEILLHYFYYIVLEDLILSIFNVFIHLCLWMWVQTCNAGLSDPMELVIQVFMNFLTWLILIKSGSPWSEVHD